MKKLKITQTQYQKLLKETRIKNLKITREQYYKLLGSGLIKENVNLIIENVDFNQIKNETGNLIKYLYRKTDNLSDFFPKNGLTYENICKLLLDNNLIVKTGENYKLNKSYGEPSAVIQGIEELLNNTINKTEINKKEIDEDESLVDDEFGVDEEKVPQLKVIGYNEEIAILKGPSSELYAFYFGDMDKDALNNITDIGGGDINENGGEGEVDNYDITKYVNDTLEELTKGEGVEGWEYGDDLVKIDDALKQELIDIYDKDPKIIGALSTESKEPLPEMTGAGSSGSFTGAFSPEFSGNHENDSIIKKEIPVIGEVTDVAGAGNFQYDTPGFVGIGRNGEYKKAPKTNAQKKTQYSGGGFVELDSCTKLNNNKSAQNGGCSQGAANNVVKVNKTKDSIISPSLKENSIYETISKKTGKSIEEIIKIIESKK